MAQFALKLPFGQPGDRRARFARRKFPNCAATNAAAHVQRPAHPILGGVRGIGVQLQERLHGGASSRFNQTKETYMLSRRTALAAAAFGAPAAFGLLRPALAESGACATDQSAANATLLERYVAAVNGNDAALRRQVFAEPYIQHGGIKGLRDIFPDLHLTVEDRIFGGDKIVARNTWTGTHRGAFLGIEPTGKQVTINTIDIWRVEGGKLAEHWDVIDIAGLQKQLRGE
jgi:predicted ester cyclase